MADVDQWQGPSGCVGIVGGFSPDNISNGIHVSNEETQVMRYMEKRGEKTKKTNLRLTMKHTVFPFVMA